MVFNPSYEPALSTPRLDSYRQIASNDDHAWDLYQWNKELVAAALPLACDLEVTLRNTVHTELTTLFGREDWWASTNIRLDEETRAMLARTVKRHRRALDRGTSGPGRVVADLMFGSWVNLVGAGGRTSLGESVDYDANLWRPALRFGFSTGELNSRGAIRRPQRTAVFTRASNFKRLRNRMAHHEPIHNGIVPSGGASRVSLLQVWNEGIELLRWMNPELARLHHEEQRLPSIANSRP